MKSADTFYNRDERVYGQGVPTEAAISAYRARLDALPARTAQSEATLNLLLDFFGSRCDSFGDLRALGETLFSALNRSIPQAVVVGRYHDRFVFARRGDGARLEVDGQTLAELPLDDANRLATLLHGSAQTVSQTQHAA